MHPTQVAVEVVNLHITDAVEFIVRNGCTSRVVTADSENKLQPEDIRDNRINLITENNVVKTAYIG